MRGQATANLDGLRGAWRTSNVSLGKRRGRPTVVTCGMVRDELFKRWWTLDHLANELGVSRFAVTRQVKNIALSELVFCRTTKLKYQPKAYRMFLPAFGVNATGPQRVMG